MATLCCQHTLACQSGGVCVVCVQLPLEQGYYFRSEHSPPSCPSLMMAPENVLASQDRQCHIDIIHQMPTDHAKAFSHLPNYSFYPCLCLLLLFFYYPIFSFLGHSLNSIPFLNHFSTCGFFYHSVSIASISPSPPSTPFPLYLCNFLPALGPIL